MSVLILELTGLLCMHLIIMLLILIVLELKTFQKKFIGDKNIHTNIFRIQAYNSVMYRYFCIGFTDFMLKDKSLTDFTNLFSLNDFKKKTIQFQTTLKMAECNSIEVPNINANLNDQQQFRLNKTSTM